MTRIAQRLSSLARNWLACLAPLAPFANRVVLAGLVAFAALPAVASALDLDPAFGAGHGYVPVSAPETQTDIAADIVRQPDDKMVILGQRMVGARGTLLLQRMAFDGTIDFLFATLGTQTIDIAGESLTAKKLILQIDNKLLVVAESSSAIRMFSFLPTGQVDTSFGSGGQISIPFATGVGPGFSSVHLMDTGTLIVITQNSPAASSSLTVSRYTKDGVLDENFGLHGKESITGLGPALSYTGVAALLADARFALVMANVDGTRALMFLNRFGQADTTVNGGKPLASAVLLGKTVTTLTPLLSGYFVAAAVSGAGGAQASTITRFDPQGQVDTQFGTGGTLMVQSADSGGSIAIVDIYETADNYLVVTGSTNNGIIVTRVLARGQRDATFNAGKGEFVVPEPGSRATSAIKSVAFGSGNIVHLAYGTLFGATATGASPARAFLIASHEGTPDVGFASKGILNLFGRSAPTAEFAQYAMPLPDGKIMVLSATGVNDGLVGTLTRYLPNGSPDPAYGTKGRSSFGLNGRCEYPLSMAIQPDGRVLVLGTSFNEINCDTSAMFGKRFDTNGLQENFTIFYSGLVQHAKSGGIALQSDGRIVVAGQDDHSLVVARFAASGAPDTGFGAGGRTLWQMNPGDETKAGAVLVRPDQKILVAGSMNGVYLVLVQLNSDGTLDASFGVNGVSLSAVPGSFLEPNTITITPAGKLLVLARSGQNALLAQFSASGALDPSFGNGGQLRLPFFIGGDQFSRFGMVVQSDGGIVVSGQSVIDTNSQVELIRLNANGQSDATFGVNGIWTWRPSIFYPAGASGVANAPAGGLYVIGYGIPGAFFAHLGTSIVTASVVEFYNTLLNHYFISADPAEQASVDNGAAGPGWTRTGMGFHAYLPALGVPPGQVQVCRFYGTITINPATGLRRGPNSHFYTAVADECAAVLQDPGWTLEGIAFYIGLPNGGCAAGLVPVYRNYNKRAAFNDSNHRYTIDPATYQLMQTLGWAGEGIVFCAAP